MCAAEIDGCISGLFSLLPLDMASDRQAIWNEEDQQDDAGQGNKTPQDHIQNHGLI